MSQKKNGSNKIASKAKSVKMSKADELLLKQVGLLIHKTLFENDKPVEWLSFKSGVARSSIREIIAGRSNARILTLNILAKHLGFNDVVELLSKSKNKNGN
jgi:hypothetical protein